MYKFVRVLALLLLFGLFSIGSLNAQNLLRDSVMNAFVIQVNYQAQFPVGELSERFGFNSAIGAALGFKMKHNVWLNFEGNFLFGSDIKDVNLLDGVTTGQGNLIGASGVLENYRGLQRGFALRVVLGKVIPVGKPNVNSGLFFQLGFGFLQHKIFIDLENEPEVPYLDDEYRKGYDRLTNGPVLSQFIGYMYLSNNKRINFYTGFEFYQGFTQGRRTWNFDTRSSGEDKRRDLLVGYKIAWLLPVYYKSTEKFYTY